MTKLFGRSHIKMDPKGRLSLPTAFRAGLNKTNGLIVTNSLYQGHRFLDLFSKNEWQKLEKKVSSWPGLKPEVQAFQRFYISSGEMCELDVQGRMLIPLHLREYAQLKDEIVLVGMGHRIEVWNAKEWSQLFGKIEKDYEQIMRVISDLDLGGRK
jgi:MraZ protein